MPGLPFVVGDEPFCVWGADDPREQNLTFLDGVAPGYFEYLARVHEAQLEHDPQHAAVALRSGYHHALETFFSLLFAAVQAPACVFAWLQKYQIGQVRELVEAVNLAKPVRHRLGIDPLTWAGVSEHVNLFRYDDPTRLTETRQLFADLWRRFAYDFLNPNLIHEYNSIKHGFRQRAGGFGLAAGLETVEGVEAPPESIEPVGGSEFGSSYFVAQPILAKGKKTPHFCVHRHAVNWSPVAMALGLQLVGVSIGNVVAYLKIANGARGKDVQFRRPVEATAFEAPWQHSVGVIHMAIDEGLDERAIRLLPKGELLALCDQEAHSTKNAEHSLPEYALRLPRRARAGRGMDRDEQ